MLGTLTIRNILIIEHLSIELHKGFNVLSGETGAGKSILLDALGFVLGWRGPANLVRQGQEHGEVEAIFALPKAHPARAILREAGFEGADTADGASELVIRRLNYRDGRKSAWVNERRCSGEFLRLLGGHLVELHGQHDERGLLDAKSHREFLDMFMDPSGKLCTAVDMAWRELKQGEEAHTLCQEQTEKLRAQEEYIRFCLGELGRLAPKAGESASLEKTRRLMQASERIRGDIVKVCALLENETFETILSDASRLLRGIREGAEGRLQTAYEALERVELDIEEVVRALKGALVDFEFSPHDLEQTEERLFAIREVARKHGVEEDALEDFTEGLRQKACALDDGAENLAKLRKAYEALQGAYQEKAEALRHARKRAGKELAQNMHKELIPLKMQRAHFETDIQEAPPSAYGIDMVHFKVATNPNTPSGALSKIASGGELARFILALKLCLNRDKNFATLIFDEIDTGIGGATADAVGRRLHALAQGSQVLVVTHSPQIAARADHHWQIKKTVTAGESTTHAKALSESERAEEIARMLAGMVVSEEALEAARALIADGAIR